MASNPSPERHQALLTKYSIPNMGDYTAVGGQLSGILDRLDANGRLLEDDKTFIRDKGLFDLCKFVDRLEKTGKEDFGCLRARQPRTYQPSRRKVLWDRYGIDFIPEVDMHRLLGLLEQVERSQRPSDTDTVWLLTKQYRTVELKRAMHKIEAQHFANSFLKSGDPWSAVNASSNFRKAELPADALDLLSKVNVDAQNDNHLRSALYTTKGGAKRDTGAREEALLLATQGHTADPRSFHPCTLIGAIHFEMGNFDLGEKWFAMAIERGATLDSLDSEVRAILRRLSREEAQKLEDHLLSTNPTRYVWLNSPKRKANAARRDASYLDPVGSATVNNAVVDQAGRDDAGEA
jgi:hypothetical protein